MGLTVQDEKAEELQGVEVQHGSPQDQPRDPIQHQDHLRELAPSMMTISSSQRAELLLRLYRWHSKLDEDQHMIAQGRSERHLQKPMGREPANRLQLKYLFPWTWTSQQS